MDGVDRSVVIRHELASFLRFLDERYRPVES